MNCPGCGADLFDSEDIKVCPECGARLGSKGAGKLTPTKAGWDKKAGKCGRRRFSEIPIFRASKTPESGREPGEEPATESSAPEPQLVQSADRRVCGSTECPVKLEVNVGRLCVQGCGGVIETRLASLVQEPLARVVVSVRFEHVSAFGEHVVRLEPCESTQPLATQMELPKGCRGEYVVRLGVVVDLPGGLTTYRGFQKILVLPPDESPQRVHIGHVGHVFRGEKAAMGAYVNAPTEVEAADLRSLSTVAALLERSGRMRPVWQEVALAVGKVVSHRTPAGPAANRLRLDISGPCKKRVLLISQREVTFGRSRRVCDISTVLLPVTCRNYDDSCLISGHIDDKRGTRSEPHVSLRLTDAGPEITDRSERGTYVDGDLIDRGTATALGRMCKVSLARVLDVEMRTFAVGEEFDHEDYLVLARGGVFEEGIRSRVAAVRIKRLSNFPQESYLVIYAGASLGSSPDAGVPLESSGLAPRHLLVLHLGDRFYVENVSGNASGTRLNGVELERDRIEPIRPGDNIEMGSVSVDVGEYEQLRPEG